MAHEFGRGEYLLRSQFYAGAVYGERNGRLFGCYWKVDCPNLAWPISWAKNGAQGAAVEGALDLLPPDPPLVIPEEAVEPIKWAFEAAGYHWLEGVEKAVLAGLPEATRRIAAANGYRREGER